MKCKHCGKRIIQSKGSWRLYGFIAGLLAGSQYRCGDDMYDWETLVRTYPNEFEGFHEPENSEVSKVTEILLNYEQ